MSKMLDTRSSEWLESGDGEYQASFHNSILDIDAQDWNKCAGVEDPFVSHEFLSALEHSKTVCKETGFEPHHIVVTDHTGNVVAAAPAYIKHHSDVEVGADMGWSLAHERMCGPYYPKLQVEVPMTPSPGPRFLVSSGQNRDELRTFLIKTMIRIVNKKGLSSLHLNFIAPDELEFLEGLGFPISHSYQFHWERKDYKDYEDFLGSMKGSRRGMIRTERRKFKDTDLEFEYLTGPTLTTEAMAEFFHLYLDTYHRYGERDFLTPEFFQEVQQRMPEKALLNTVKKNGEFIAGTLHYMGSDTIFAHHWGCKEHIKFLHFETTYYKAIDYCFDHGFSKINAGQGGKHKANRGILPFFTHHAHWFKNTEFEKAIIKSVAKKQKLIKVEMDKAMAVSPYVDRKKNDTSFFI